MNGLLKLGFKRPLQQGNYFLLIYYLIDILNICFYFLLADMQELHPDDESSALSSEFQEIWEKERKGEKYFLYFLY